MLLIDCAANFGPKLQNRHVSYLALHLRSSSIDKDLLNLRVWDSATLAWTSEQRQLEPRFKIMDRPPCTSLLLSTVTNPFTGKTNKRPPPISTLPTEILIQILKYVHYPRYLYNCVLVSRRWCICAVELLWLQVVISQVWLLTDDSISNPGLPNDFRIESQSLQAHHRCFSSPSLDTSHITYVSCISPIVSLLTDTAGGFPAPVKPDFQLGAPKPFPTSTTTKNNESGFVINRSLEDLRLSNLTRITDEAIENIILRAPNLLHLWTLRCVNLSTDKIVDTFEKLNRHRNRLRPLWRTWLDKSLLTVV